jgi:hypothetical protein
MSLASALASAHDKALRDADTVVDDVLLSRNLKSVAESIARRHQIEPVRLHRVVMDIPHPTKMAVPGDPGKEEPAVVPGTAVELFVTVDGAATLALAGEDDDELSHAGVTVDTAGQRIVVRYATENPQADKANRFFEAAMRAIETTVEGVNRQVGEFNEALEPAVAKELEECKQRAEVRKKFAAGLKLPDSYERWWGRP